MGLLEENHLSIFKHADNAEEEWDLIKNFNDNTN